MCNLYYLVLIKLTIFYLSGMVLTKIVLRKCVRITPMFLENKNFIAVPWPNETETDQDQKMKEKTREMDHGSPPASIHSASPGAQAQPTLSGCLPLEMSGWMSRLSRPPRFSSASPRGSSSSPPAPFSTDWLPALALFWYMIEFFSCNVKMELD